MKLKWYHWIPIYGLIKYNREYFKAESRSWKDAYKADQFNQIHLGILLIGGFLIISILKRLL